MTNNIWREFIEQNPGTKQLPVILPAVLYHGKGNWNCPRSLAEIMETGEGLEQYIPQFTYDLFDLRDYEDERLLLGDAMALGVVLYLMKHIFDEDFGEHIESAMGTSERFTGRKPSWNSWNGCCGMPIMPGKTIWGRILTGG